MSRDDVVTDYLNRALLRRDTAASMYSAGSWVDVVRDARMTVDMVTLAAMHHMDMPIPKEAVASDRLPNDTVRHIDGIERFFEKERCLRDMASTVIPSSFFSQEDADAALIMADNMMRLFIPQIRPEMNMSIPDTHSRKRQSFRM